MPQVDKFTFYTIVFWTFVIYLSGYLVLSAVVFYGFLTKSKTNLGTVDLSTASSSALRGLSSSVYFFSLVVV